MTAKQHKLYRCECEIAERQPGSARAGEQRPSAASQSSSNGPVRPSYPPCLPHALALDAGKTSEGKAAQCDRAQRPLKMENLRESGQSGLGRSPPGCVTFRRGKLPYAVRPSVCALRQSSNCNRRIGHSQKLAQRG